MFMEPVSIILLGCTIRVGFWGTLGLLQGLQCWYCCPCVALAELWIAGGTCVGFCGFSKTQGERKV